MLSSACIQVRDGLAQLPYLAHINNDGEYHQALALMDQLFEDYDTNKALIDLLSISIERWEEKSEEFRQFNTELAELNNGITVLKTLMAQYKLSYADLPELGSKGNVSKLLNETNNRQLTRKHILALSQRFGVSPELFL